MHKANTEEGGAAHAAWRRAPEIDLANDTSVVSVISGGVRVLRPMRLHSWPRVDSRRDGPESPPDAGPLHATCARVSRRRSVGKHPTWRISPQTLQVGRMSPRLAGACVQPGSRMPTLSPTSPSLLSGSVDDDIYDICLPDGGPRRVTAVPLGALAGRPF